VIAFGDLIMANDLNYELPPSSDLELTNEEPSNEMENDIAEFELNIHSNEGQNSKLSNKRNFLAKKKIEQLQEERRLRKLEADYFDDWD
jgi:hypothetical protein